MMNGERFINYLAIIMELHHE